MHGYQIMNELAERTGGVWRPSPGSIYPSLQMLQDEGLVKSVDQDGRRVFELTELGTEAAAKASSEPTPWEAVAGEGDAEAVELRDLVTQVIGAARSVVHAGEPAQIEQAKESCETPASGSIASWPTTPPSDRHVPPGRAHGASGPVCVVRSRVLAKAFRFAADECDGDVLHVVIERGEVLCGVELRWGLR